MMQRSERPGRGERKALKETGAGKETSKAAKALQAKKGKDHGSKVGKSGKKLTKGSKIGFMSRKKKKRKSGPADDHRPATTGVGMPRPFTPPANEAQKTFSIKREGEGAREPAAASRPTGKKALSGDEQANGGAGPNAGERERGSGVSCKRSQRVAEREAGAERRRDTSPSSSSAMKRPRLALVLLRKEVDADFLAISGRRAPKRGRKSRAKMGTGHLSLCRSLSFKY